MTRKISSHDGDLVVNDELELDGQVTGRLVVEPGGSVVIRGSVVGPTLTVRGTRVPEAAHDNTARNRDTASNRADDVIGEIP